MKQIQIPNKVFIKTLGYQKPTSEGKYRLLAYSLLQKVSDGTLLYNTLSCEMLLLSDDEVKDIFSSDYLREHWFIVPERFDDMKFARQFKSLYQLLVPKRKIVSQYTILTTTDCNARCFYCYEKGRSRVPMTIETADRLADYIISNYNKDKSDKKTVSLNWFGGEPLYNSRVIYHICERLTREGVPFSSDMTSNGYLFDSNLVSDAKNLWKLRFVQITLDGTEKVYNRSKAYIYKGVNAFERVLENIRLLLEARIHVAIRLNIDLYNADDLLSLVDVLRERFGRRSGLKCYCHPLFELAGDKPRQRTEQDRDSLYQKMTELNEKLATNHFKLDRPAPQAIRVAQCMADNGNSIVVVPTGEIGLCEHFSETEFFSSLSEPDRQDPGVKRSFAERCPDLDICSDCAFYPHCIRLRKCIEGSICFDHIKQQHIDDLLKSMTATYKRWKKNGEKVIGTDGEEDDQPAPAFC